MAAVKSGPRSHGRRPVCFGPADYLPQDNVLETPVEAAQFRGLAGTPLSHGAPGLPPLDSPNTFRAASLGGGSL